MKRFFINMLVLSMFLGLCTDAHSQLGVLKGAVNKVRKNKSEESTEKSDDKKSGETPKKGTKSVELLQDQGILNDTHRDHVGQIVFAKEKILFDKPDASKFTGEFGATDYIWARWFLAKSTQNTILELTGKKHENAVYYYDLYINGEKKEFEIESDQLHGEYFQRTTQQLKIYVPAGDDIGANNGWTEIVNKLEPGTYDIKVDLKMRSWGGDPITEPDHVFATGSFKFTKKAGESIKIGKSAKTFAAGMSDKNLEASMLKCIQNYAKSSGWKETFKQVTIKSEDWNIQRHSISGVIVARSVSAYCFATWPDGHCTVQTFVFAQEYNGSGYNKSVYYDGLISGSQEVVDCE